MNNILFNAKFISNGEVKYITNETIFHGMVEKVTINGESIDFKTNLICKCLN